jgi:site-specific recombinase XerD
MTQEFIRERQYFKAVSPKTIIWYGCSFAAFQGALESKQAIQQRIVELRQRNASPITINSYLRCINSYFRWLHVEHGKDLVIISKLKEEQKILATFLASAIKSMVSYRAATLGRRRVHTLVCLLLDTGLRISEALSPTNTNVDLDNLAIKVYGKAASTVLCHSPLSCASCFGGGSNGHRGQTPGFSLQRRTTRRSASEISRQNSRLLGRSSV